MLASLMLVVPLLGAKNDVRQVTKEFDTAPIERVLGTGELKGNVYKISLPTEGGTSR
jgi:hypothetical protein